MVLKESSTRWWKFQQELQLLFLLAYVSVFFPLYQMKFPNPNQIGSTVLEIKFIAEA